MITVQVNVTKEKFVKRFVNSRRYQNPGDDQYLRIDESKLDREKQTFLGVILQRNHK